MWVVVVGLGVGDAAVADPAPSNCAGDVSCETFYYQGTTPLQQCRIKNGDGLACSVGSDGDGAYTPVVQTGSGTGTRIVGGSSWATQFQRPIPTIAQAQRGSHGGYYLDPDGDAARFAQVEHDPGPDDYRLAAVNDQVNGWLAIRPYGPNGKVLCYGQAACDAAWKYSETYPKDRTGAAFIAANYCYVRPGACVAYDRERGASTIFVTLAWVVIACVAALGLATRRLVSPRRRRQTEDHD